MSGSVWLTLEFRHTFRISCTVHVLMYISPPTDAVPYLTPLPVILCSQHQSDGGLSDVVTQPHPSEL